jgi:hypothetical protein
VAIAFSPVAIASPLIELWTSEDPLPFFKVPGCTELVKLISSDIVQDWGDWIWTITNSFSGWSYYCKKEVYERDTERPSRIGRLINKVPGLLQTAVGTLVKYLVDEFKDSQYIILILPIVRKNSLDNSFSLHSPLKRNISIPSRQERPQPFRKPMIKTEFSLLSIVKNESSKETEHAEDRPVNDLDNFDMDDDSELNDLDEDEELNRNIDADSPTLPKLRITFNNGESS